MELAKFQTLTQDAFSGKVAPAFNAPRDGFSILMDTVNLSVTNVPHGRAVEIALPAMEDTSYQRVHALPTQVPSMAPATSFALSGKVLHASDAPKELSSIRMDFVYPLILNVKPGILSMETAYLAMPDISYPLMEDALNHPFKPLLMPDALVGVLISRPVLNALTGSSSIPMENAKKSQIFVLLGAKRMDSALAAILDTILSVMDHAVFLLPTMIPKMSDVLPGTGISKSVFNAQTTGFSTMTMSVSLFLISAPPSIILELVFHAIKDITSTMENAALRQSSKYLMSDALHGTGINKFAFNAQTTGSSTITMFASQSQINALPLITLVLANHAIKDITSTMENAALRQSSKYLMSDVLPGTGTNKSVFSALTIGCSTITTFVSLFLINALPSITLEPVNLAIKVITLTKEDASLPPSNKSLTLAVPPGTGTSKHVFNAPTTGSSTKTDFVSLSLTNALLSITPELVFHAIKVIILRTENAVKHPLSKFLMSDVQPGTGINKFAFNAPTIGSSTLTTFASLFLINAPPSTTLVLADHAIEVTT